MQPDATYYTLRAHVFVHRTIMIEPSLHIDIDEEGHVLGIEKLGDALHLADALGIINTLTLPDPAERADDIERHKRGSRR